MPLLRRTLLASLTTLAIAGPAHAAEQVYTCDGGAFLTVNAYEARVTLSNSDGFSIALPFIGNWDHFRVWSPHTEPVDDDMNIATPSVVQTYHSPQGEPTGTSFDLGDGSGDHECELIRKD